MKPISGDVGVLEVVDSAVVSMLEPATKLLNAKKVCTPNTSVKTRVLGDDYCTERDDQVLNAKVIVQIGLKFKRITDGRESSRCRYNPPPTTPSRPAC